MLSQKVLLNFLEKKRVLIEETDPNRIYVENIRSFLNVNTRVAAILCDLAARRGVFKKYEGLICPRCDRIIKELVYGEQPESTVECFQCEWEDRDFEYDSGDLEKTIFFKYVKREGED